MDAGNDEPFLVYDNGPEAVVRVVMFGTETALRHLAQADVWYMDGNFALAPKFLSQLYVIRTALGDAAITCTYALLAGKSREVYEEMLRGITRKCDALGYTADPRRIVVDYEQVRYGKVCELVENIGNCGYWMLSTFVLC